jgi:two-component system OmpR family sensor kinase
MSSPNEPPPVSRLRSKHREWRRHAPWKNIDCWSLRDQLLCSHVGLATLILLGFSVTLYWTTSRATYREAEADLLATAHLMLRDLATDPAAMPIVSGTYFHRFGPAPRDQAYFAIWDAAGKRIAASERLPPEAVPAESALPTHGPRPFLARSYGSRLDVLVATPQGGQLLVGRPLAKEFDGIWRLLFRLVLIGLACLALSIVSAWWLARRVTQPLLRLTTEAEAIHSRNLDRRLDIGRASREVGRLTMVFNAMLERLATTFAQQARFTADAAHELRTPVSVVLSQAEHTLSRERSPQDYRAALDTCLRAAQRMRKLVEDLLQLSRADTGKLLSRRETHDLSEIVRSGADLLHPLAAAKTVRLEKRLSPVAVLGDPDQLTQVTTNLIINALQYNVADGEVVVETRRDGSDALLIVRDRGLGIPQADQSHLFERFYRADRARTHETETGTGLGLSIVAEIVAAHGGTIVLESAPNVGTTVIVRLPAATSAVERTSSAVTDIHEELRR